MTLSGSSLWPLPLCLALVGGCQAVLGIERLEASADTADASVPTLDASADAPAEALVDAPEESINDAPVFDEPETELPCDPTCMVSGMARAACRPAGPDGESLKEPLVFAVNSVRGGMDAKVPQDWLSLGLDLDCLNTGETGEPASCKAAPSAGGKKVQDGLQGRDNSFGNNFGGLMRDMVGALNRNVEEKHNEALRDGVRSVLLVIEDFNGEPDDPKVTLTMLLSVGTVDETKAHVAPSWNGQDVWSVDSNCVAQFSGEPKFKDSEAYVSGHVLVAHMPNGVSFSFHAENSDLVVGLNHSTLQMRLSDDLKHLTDGVISGVWPRVSAAEALSGYANGLGICPGNFAWPLLEQAIANSVDIRLDGIPSPESECQGISLGAAFTAERALRGPVVDPPEPVPNPCVD